MADFEDILASYVPNLIVRRLSEDTMPLSQPQVDQYSAAVLFADISGFTSLTETLGRSGPQGLEKLTQVLNSYFGPITDLILAQGGDVLKFAGDALLATWIADTGCTLATATHQAVECGLMIQDYAHTYTPPAGISLSLRICIGAGDITIAHIGGVLNRWDYTITGTPLTQINQLFAQDPPSGVALSSYAWALVQAVGQGTQLPLGNVLVQTILPAPLPAAASIPTAPTDGLRSFIPGAILARLSAGQRDWLAEYRQITLLFINLPNLQGDIGQMQAIMVALQQILYRFEGSVNKISVDDKGITLIAALGLPPLAHEDDPERGMRAALAMQKEILAQGEKCQIGVSTGSVFCGTIGSSQRREYTVIGEVVNLAARLMQTQGQTVLCDQATYQATQGKLTYGSLPPQRLKGFEQPVAIYYPLNITEQKQAVAATTLVGCQRERRHLIQMAHLLRTDQQAGCAILEGEAGIGKSQLLNNFLQWAKDSLPYFLGMGDAIEQLTPYHAWRLIFQQLLELHLDPVLRQQQVLMLLGSNSPSSTTFTRRPAELAPLLNVVLDVDFPETDLTQQMQGTVRADNIRALLLHLLQLGIGSTPTILAFEDAHWLDSASWALLRALNQKSWPILMVIATRPLADPIPDDYQQMLTAEPTKFLRLPGLSRAETHKFVCQQLGVQKLSETVTNYIYQKAEGHPLLSEELAYALRDEGGVAIANNQCDWTENTSPDVTLNLPTTLQGLMTSRIDRLVPAQQLLLKSASVIGRSFVYPLLYDIYPLAADKDDLPENLQTLHRQNLVYLESSEPLAYAFRHILMQEVTYQLMLFSQRRALHRAIATWYERSPRQEAYALLAYHWSRAEDNLKALEYLDKAGEQSLTSGAYKEAISFFTQALELTPANHTRQARWHRQLGEAHLGLGQLENSEHHLRSTVALLGKPIPKHLWFSLLQQVGQQFLHRWRSRSPTGTPSAIQIKRLELTRAYINLGEVYYYSHRRTLATYACITGLNIAETADPSPELARIYANMCFAMGVNQQHNLAHRYGILAETTIQNLDAPLPCLGWVAMVTGAYHSGSGRWTSARERLKLAIDSYQTLSDLHHLAESIAALALVEHCQGNFNIALTLWQQTHQLGNQCGDIQAQAWGILGEIEENLAIAQSTSEKIGSSTFHLLQLAQRLLTDQPGLVSEQIRLTGLSALLLFHQGKRASSKQTAAAALTYIQQSPPVALYVLEGYASALEATYHLNTPLLQQNACAALKKYAQAFPIGQPRLFYWRGQIARTQGNLSQARRLWQKGLDLATQLQMPYEKALIDSAWATLSTSTDSTWHQTEATR